jgi:inner membrane protein
MWWVLIAHFFLVTASHGMLDAITNGGLGVAFFAPFDNSRHFFSWRPVLVSPIGIVPFFSRYGLDVLISELVWIWLPVGASVLIAKILWKKAL